MQKFKASPNEMATSIWRNRGLIYALTKREVIGRYRGSLFGILWSFFYPVLMLAVYTFVFSVVFKARWPGGSDSKTQFALILFAGLLMFNLFAECINRAPGLILSNVNYVKKVVFPLEVLPVVVLGSALFHAMISLLAWLIFYFVFFGIPPATALLLPIVVVPLAFFVLGVSWLIASLAVFLRDIAQFIGIFVTILMFMSPIFYPASGLPKTFHSVFLMNPLTPAIETTRDLLIWGTLPDWPLYGCYFSFALLVCWAGFAWFQKSRKGFADVL